MSPADLWPRSRFPFLDLLERHTATFLEEYDALPDEAFAPMPHAAGYSAPWWACPVFLDQWQQDFPGVVVATNQARCPRTAGMLQQIPGLVVGGFLRLERGGTIAPHTDLRDDDVIRAHLGLRLPPHERAYWPEGTARLMDIRQRHEAHNRDGDGWRVTLMVDVRMPDPVPEGVIAPWGPPQS